MAEFILECHKMPVHSSNALLNVCQMLTKTDTTKFQPARAYGKAEMFV